MALWSIITRVADGFPLCESTDPVPVTGAETQKTQAKQILKRLDARSPARLARSSHLLVTTKAPAMSVTHAKPSTRPHQMPATPSAGSHRRCAKAKGTPTPHAPTRNATAAGPGPHPRSLLAQQLGALAAVAGARKNTLQPRQPRVQVCTTAGGRGGPRAQQRSSC